MHYADNENKFAAAVNRNIAAPLLFNALGHCFAGLASVIGEAGEFLPYRNSADDWTANISRYPVIILSAKNSGQLRRLVSELSRDGFPFNCFTAAMIGDSAAMQQQQVVEDKAPEYWAVAAFGDGEQLRPLTKSFSLFK